MTNEHDSADAHIDAALEALARPEPPAGHLARVLARTGPEEGHRPQAAGDRRQVTRSVLAVAATGLVALGVAWQVTRVGLALPDVAVDRSASGPGHPGGSDQPWGTPQAVDRPVLPPQAYWGMDAFEEWASLRPGRGSREAGVGNRRRAASTSGRTGAPMAWVPVSSGLPPIALDDITPAPLEMPMLPALDPIAIEDITLAPIDVTPVNDQETP